ncbi:E3 ubiquitin-protein ligase HRD1 isoform X2 [Topomyia yanbarensis]|nr:E3 ubiquitin-protein ligase HRD1 isoform X2 [Topomyia yanbarensis]XP_058814133.1 E3 ubiquitin-protein ligase HRD1 isoform X2 [Topomyia yanbarensis]XP_058814134.1 E3 ubiquitin-protein ligase HRD1 isoform X2 [Topomyia yanbarensis]XP_058814135.1 E3 ubiquitin-protein ligase HRD1 isoform X2 [Topomyia yanbarensis]XP_058814136.1 E3 ubiquitin-protein ligase HRD1 isoform X2 [Topomyia yanbarensis]
MRALGISVISLALTSLVLGNAYYQKKQFYPSVVYITKSNPSMAVIYIQSLVLVLMLGKLMKKVFLGTLRAAEFEHLMERFWYALTETCLAFTVFRDDFNPKFVALFTVLLFLKSFHWLAEDRVDYMERSPVIGWIFHLRVAGLLACLGVLDHQLISYAYQSTIAKGATVQLVFGFEYAILMTMVLNTAIKYMFHAAELRSETPWENKAVFLLYTELIIGFIRVVLYVIFVILMVKIYTLPLFAFRPMYYTMRNFKKALNDVILSRRAIRNMNTLYPDATQEELQLSDNICIICREDMINSSKKLPCGHIFHTACLRSWFQRQQTCPTCRLNILRTPITTIHPNPVQPTDSEMNNLVNTNEANTSTGIGASTTAAAQSTVSSTSNSAALVTGAPLVLSPLPFMGMPLPPVPPALDTLTDAELRAMEGNDRHHIEQRIKHLQNIRTLMDASVALMNQYSAIVARLPTVSVPVEGNPSSSTDTASITPMDIPGPSQMETSSDTKQDIVNISLSRKVKATVAELEDLGSDDESITAKDHLPDAFNELLSTPSQQQSVVATSFASSCNRSNVMYSDDPEKIEIRRRRLEKFGTRASSD